MSHKSKKVPAVCGLILAGGRGTRMAHQDKGLVLLKGRPLIRHVIDRVEPQVNRLLINSNRHSQTYQQFGYPLIEDAIRDFRGPLRGILSARPSVGDDYCFVVPCDMPYVPRNVVQQLQFALADHDAAYVVAERQIQPLVLLLKPSVIPQIDAYLTAGGRSVQGWLRTLNTIAVSFDHAENFNNINNSDQLAAAADLPLD